MRDRIIILEIIIFYFSAYATGFVIADYSSQINDTTKKIVRWIASLFLAAIALTLILFQVFPLENNVIRLAGIGAYCAKITYLPDPPQVLPKTKDFLVVAEVDRMLFVQKYWMKHLTPTQMKSLKYPFHELSRLLI